MYTSKIAVRLSLLMVFIISACSPKDTPMTEEAIVEDEVLQTADENQPDLDAGISASAPSSIDGYCDNPFYPVSEGRTWQYRMTSQGETSDLSFTSQDVTDEAFTHVLSSEGVSSEIRWQCGPDGLFTTQVASMFFMSIPNFSVETIDVEGVAFPPASQWQIGATWKTQFNVRVTMAIGEETIEGEGVILINNTITAIEPVSVPAGSYDNAYRVDAQGEYAFSVMGFETTIQSNSTNWYAEGVGMVKSMSSDAEMSYLMELMAVEN